MLHRSHRMRSLLATTLARPKLFTVQHAKYHTNTSTTVTNAVLKVHFNTGNIDSAFELFNHTKNKNIIIFSIMIDGLFQHKEHVKGKEIFEQMIQQGIQPNETVFNTMIHGYLKNGKSSEALQVYDSMEKYNVTPGVVTFTSIIEYLCNNDLNTGLDLFSQVEKKNAVTYTVVINALIQQQAYKKSTEERFQPETYINDMIKNGITPNAHFISVVLKWAWRHGDVKEENILNDLVKRFNVKPSVGAINATMDELIQQDMIERAWKLFNTSEIKNVTSYNIMLKGCKTIDKVESLLEQMKKEGFTPDEWTRTTLKKKKRELNLYSKLFNLYQSI
jgi:leucine-rich PPR motif-containing protein